MSVIVALPGFNLNTQMSTRHGNYPVPNFVNNLFSGSRALTSEQMDKLTWRTLSVKKVTELLFFKTFIGKLTT
jgi:hypothetical protein